MATSALNQEAAAVADVVDDAAGVVWRLVESGESFFEESDHFFFGHLRLMVIMERAGYGAEEAAFLIGVHFADGAALGELGAVPFIEQCVGAFFVERDAVLGDGTA